jgi:hypothetical protein
VNRTLAAVARLRELPPKGAVRGVVVSRKQMVDHVASQLRTELPPEVIAATERMLILFGVVPPDFNYEASLLTLMTAQLAGFYEPRDKTMYLAGDLGGPESEATLSHELVHALQDQHYDLAPRIKYRADASDEQSAIHALAEGDATSAMLDQQLVPRGSTATDLPDRAIELEAHAMLEVSPETAGVPTILKRSVIAPYIDGILFVHWARRQGGWARVNSVWRRPPATTEQLLHPDKYLKNEPAELIPIPANPALADRAMYHDILGEQALRLMFEEWLPRAKAVSAATGWSGDRLAVFSRGDEAAAAWHLRFDDAAGALQAADVFARGLSRPASGSAAPDTDAERRKRSSLLRARRFCNERAQLGPAAVGVTGRDVAIALGPYLHSARKSSADCTSAVAWVGRMLGSRPDAPASR